MYKMCNIYTNRFSELYFRDITKLISSRVLKSERSDGQEANERGTRMSEGVEATAIDKRDEKRASKAWKSRAMHRAALDSSTEAGGREGKSIESRLARTNARRGEREGRARGPDGERREGTRARDRRRAISLSFSLLEGGGNYAIDS